MRNLFNRLPSFSPDYCGASGVFYEMNGLTIMCDPGPCTGTVLAMDEPRLDMSNSFHCMQLGQKQAVFGFDEELLDKARRVLKEQARDFVVILGTPISATLATDYKGLACKLSKEFHIPGFGIDTKSIDTYDVGQKKAFDTLARQAVKEEADRCIDVNVLGATALDMWDVNQVNDLIDLLKECGANHVSVWGRNGGLSEIVQGAGTKINLVVSASAVSAAKILQKKYGTPYLVGYPIGKTQVELWKKKLTKILQNQEMPEKRECEAVEATGMSGCKKICAKKYEKRALIVAEQISANAIRECLKSEFLYEKVDVASFFMMDSVSMEDGDQKLPDEDALVEMMGESGKYDLVICDPLIYPLLPYKPKRTMPYPHTAISGRIFWSRSANFFGEKGTEYIREQIGDKNA